MKIHAYILIAILSFAALAGADGRLSPRFRTVYILEMSNGLDQHLASRLTANRALFVVLDPGNADAVLTQSVDDPFWGWLAKTYPPSAATSATALARGSASRAESSGGTRPAGMVFLVDPRTRVVLWSGWENLRSPTPIELDRAAGKFANQIKAAFEKK